MRYLILTLWLLISGTTMAMELKATVNDTPLSDLDVKNWGKLLKMQQPQVYDRMEEKKFQKQVLDNLIESTIKKQTAIAAGAKASKQDLQNALNHLEQQNGLKQGDLPNFLNKNGVPLKTMIDQVEADLLWLQYLHSHAADLKVSDLAVDKRYQAMRKELKSQGIKGDHITLWEIAQGVFPENVNVSTTLESKTCDAFLEHIKIGPYPESAQRGWVDPKQFPPELYDLLSDIAVGETLGPMQTPKGILVMMKCDLKTQQVMPTKEQVKTQLEIEQLDLLSRRLLAEATRKSTIEKKE